MKYTNNGKMKNSSFPFIGMGMGMINMPENPSRTKVTKDHRHTSDYIIDQGNEEEVKNAEAVPSNMVEHMEKTMGINSRPGSKTKVINEDTTA